MDLQPKRELNLKQDDRGWTFFDWDRMCWTRARNRSSAWDAQERLKCAHREHLLQFLGDEIRNGDSLTKLYAMLLLNAIKTLNGRLKKKAEKQSAA